MKIRADNLVKQYGPNKALDGVSLEIAPGSIVAMLGANGAGKTTLLNALAGVIPLENGRVYFDDQLYTPASGDLRRRFALLPDIPPVAPFWTPLRLMGSMLKLYRRPANEDAAEKTLADLDLLSVATWKLHRPSRGQSYKAVLASFIVADPEVWFVDEPFSSGMDPRGLNCFKDYARQAASRGHTIVYSTQIIEVAEQFSTRICVLEHGRIAADETVDSPERARKFASLFSHLREQPAP